MHLIIELEVFVGQVLCYAYGPDSEALVSVVG